METRSLPPLFTRTSENKMLNTLNCYRSNYSPRDGEKRRSYKSREATGRYLEGCEGGGGKRRDGRRVIEITMARRYARAATHNGRARGIVKAVSTVNRGGGRILL